MDKLNKVEAAVDRQTTGDASRSRQDWWARQLGYLPFQNRLIKDSNETRETRFKERQRRVFRADLDFFYTSGNVAPLFKKRLTA